MKTFYCIHLNPGSRGLTDRFALYERDEDGALSVIWGDTRNYPVGDKPGNERRAIRYPYQVYKAAPVNRPDNLPAFHFALTGGFYNKRYELACALARHFGEDVEILELRGWQPSRTVAHFSDVRRPE